MDSETVIETPVIVDEIQLANMFVSYAAMRKNLAEIENKIKSAILDLRESRKIAGVTATYYQPSHKTPDYEGECRAFMQANHISEVEINPFQTMTISTRWKDACEHFGVDAPLGEETPARVVVK